MSANATILAASNAAAMGYTPHVVLACYMVLLLVLGLVGFLKSRTTEEDYYLAGRGQGVIVTSLTIMATMFSSAAMLGIPGLVYKDGAAFLMFALNLPVSGALVYLLGSRIARLGRSKGYVTPADLVSDYYGDSSMLRLLVALVGFLYVLPYIIMQIKAGGYLAQRMFPDAQAVTLFGQSWDVFDIGTIALSVVTMLYVLIGGMRSVAWTDVVQGMLLLCGMILAGVATIFAMGGIREFFRQISDLPVAALSVPGASGIWGPWKMLTICIFASLATMIQPGQWMRYYAARSTETLRRSAIIFATVLPICFLFGVMLVGLGGRAMYPPITDEGTLLPHPEVGSTSSEFDQIVIVMIQNHVPDLLGPIGVTAVAIILVAVMAASMSTADSNLHALSAVMTRDVYDRFLRPGASEKEKAWLGRSVIVVVTLLALGLVYKGKADPNFKALELIAMLMFVAIGFSCQLAPVALDVLFIRRGTRAGAIAGMIAGISVVFLFTPFPTILLGEDALGTIGLDETVATLRRLFDVGFCGFVVNTGVFVVVSLFTRKPDPSRVAEFAAIMSGRSDSTGTSTDGV